MIETFKILSNIYDSRVTNFLSKSHFSTTRGHSFMLFVQHANFNIRSWFFSIRIVDIWNRLHSNVVNASNAMCLEKRLDICWADLKIKFDHEAPLNYSELNYSKINKSQNIDIDGELSVEANAIWGQYKTCEYDLPTSITIALILVKPFVKNIGFAFHCQFTKNKHVSTIAKTGKFELCRLASVCCFLTNTVTATHIYAFLLWIIDYCDSHNFEWFYSWCDIRLATNI